MKYIFMLGIAFCLAIISSIMTALGMMDLFNAVGIFILLLFIIIDLGRFLLFNFLVDEWNNLRLIKYFVSFILAILFVYSAVGIYAKLDSLVSKETKQAMVNMASLNEKSLNAEVKKTRSEDLVTIAKQEYDTAIAWNKTDYENCLSRAKNNKNRLNAENNCNNTKRRLDKNALAKYEETLKQANETLTLTENAIQIHNENKSEVASVLTTICKITQKDCTTYDSLQNALTILIFLVIIGTDCLQIAIILAVNTRKNKINKDISKIEIVPSGQKMSLKTQIENKEQTEENIVEKTEKIEETDKEKTIDYSNTPARRFRNFIKENFSHNSAFIFHGPKPKNSQNKKR